MGATQTDNSYTYLGGISFINGTIQWRLQQRIFAGGNGMGIKMDYSIFSFKREAAYFIKDLRPRSTHVEHLVWDITSSPVAQRTIIRLPLVPHILSF